jgi:hypothetical protein
MDQIAQQSRHAFRGAEGIVTNIKRRAAEFQKDP